MLDMFGSESPVVESAQANVVPAAETCDDQDGYYKATIGEVIRNYKVTEILGKGVFGSVVRAVSVETEEEVAIKIVRVDAVYRMSGETERNILKYLNDNDPRSKCVLDAIDKKYIIRMIESFDHMKHLCIVLEALHMNLRDTLNKYGKNIGLSLPIVRFYAKQLFVALYFLKVHHVVHADCKDSCECSETR
eukprot:TRINITY_DN8869_c0_g1_i17.p2 TRINITY_DN8869_c0_g1~~TRINITY_DN8869_c0_g1_i17.p2  ORF type:complete len:191 (+),score=45.49 TRINITY_DN8869_c0_g1_i17:855-1427(+)